MYAEMMWEQFAISIVLTIAAYLIAFKTPNFFKKFDLVLRVASGDTAALTSSNREYLGGVKAEIETAMMDAA